MSAEDYNPIYDIGHSLSYNLFNLMFRCDSVGAENVPKEGPFILACNHVSYFDPFLAGSQFRRRIYFFARKTLFSSRFKAWILNRFHAIPVDRDGDSDVGALKRVFKVLESGNGILLFPEGTRSKDGQVQPGKRGVGMIACRTQVPVVPVRFFGAFEAWRKGDKLPNFNQDITIAYGKPLFPKDYDPGKNAENRYQVVTDKILDAIRHLEKPKFNGA
ncbi:MAG: 1-acyl-sn-glycerol-3-phosphate acyltransferase [Verrucomicrobia bacterium CG_4_10_14_3_um_filter_43_23]|nr:MAG: hypothetical protein AUJ82_01935 [Verrucomicrobia bacterium CG1_02_43_26]PIP59655.1 MAG: 1-acyl-sn-glycerol-3-phosphate acyltransferase [Verrucomicrobia bacterium CG22_combo_CG10-13_8_21_14_all_43_17]PIX58954.1 MAG: 1-acyl-sn-glycerol-3-phosphate acyltransferase [Verrucomicrobia bacterium CG_4_10_14_3_um_filter_43_23]PIY63099.1 MAG: 1-acyl-sn-glycerol-3-phosphate acyltransferase [Verrucomicrobia bacterium CG_4_10_14_0_8_um_filter_43_34]PJA43606.1 MAG: 1-acyl-sn-glycerol-3-phosphate acyl